MSTEGWSTHCFGRYLIDLPPQARIGAGYTIWGEQIELTNIPASSVDELLSAREAEIRSVDHETAGSMWVRRADHGNGSATIISWSRPYSEAMMQAETYLIADGPRGSPVFLYSGAVAPEKIDTAISFYGSLSRSIRSRDTHEIPTEPGFCIDGGYIAGSEYMAESFRVGIALPQHPGMHMTFRSSTGAEEEGLLERVGGFFRTEVLGRALGVDTLRKRRRSVGPIAGEEYLVAGGDDRQRVYAFRWEFQGRDDSLAEPNLSLEMGVLERDPGDDGSLPPPAFESDDEALQLWDAILETIRPRPGAA